MSVATHHNGCNGARVACRNPQTGEPIPVPRTVPAPSAPYNPSQQGGGAYGQHYAPQTATYNPPQAPYPGPSQPSQGPSLGSSPPRITGSNDGRASEKLDASYVVRKKPAEFFRVGKVFSVLWDEPAGAGAPSYISQVTMNYLGEYVHSKIRRMIVLRASHESCWAISIHTYNGKGAARKGLKKSDHGIVYTGKDPPEPEKNEWPASMAEAPMRSTAIKVLPSDPTGKLDKMSRINYAKVYTVEFNVKAKDFGMVHPDYLQALETQFRAVNP